MQDTILSARETRKLALLREIDAREHPSKADLCRGLPNKTRAYYYSAVDDLIQRGLVQNTGEGYGHPYRLDVTPLGFIELETWDEAER